MCRLVYPFLCGVVSCLASTYFLSVATVGVFEVSSARRLVTMMGVQIACVGQLLESIIRMAIVIPLGLHRIPDHDDHIVECFILCALFARRLRGSTFLISFLRCLFWFFSSFISLFSFLFLVAYDCGICRVLMSRIFLYDDQEVHTRMICQGF